MREHQQELVVLVIAMLLATIALFRVASCAETPNRMEGSFERHTERQR